MTKKIRVGLLGHGNIVYNESNKSNEYILTHRQAIEELSELELAAIYDIKRIDHPLHKDTLDGFFKSDLQLVVVATPTNLHCNHLQLCQKNNIPYILLEKPITHNIEALETFKSTYSRTDHITLNFPRHFDHSINEVKKRISSNDFGKCLHFTGALTKGFIHNGAHLFDLLSLFFGDSYKLNPINLTKKNQDIQGGLEVIYKNFSGTLTCLDQTDYSLFEAIFYFENARLSVLNGGRKIIIDHAKASPLYQGFSELNHQELVKETLGQAYKNTYKFLLNSDKNEAHGKIQSWINQLDRLIAIKDKL